MTVPVPPYARRKPVFWLWRFNWRLRRKLHGYKRNPDCNEKRRYKDDTGFISGKHTHLEPLYQGGHRFEQIRVPFTPFKFDGTTNDDSIVLSNWNWFDKGTIE